MRRIALPIFTMPLLFAAWTWAAEPQTEQDKAIAAIEKLGGKVTVDEKSPGKPVNSVDLGEKQGDRRWAGHLKGLTELQSLNLSGPR